MGPRTAEAQRRVTEQRRRIDHSLDVVESEARSDLRGAQDRVQEIAGDAQEQVAALPGMHMLNAQIEQHPMTSVIAGFTLGIAAGIAMDSFGSDESDDDEADRRRRAKKQRSAKRKRNRGQQSDMLRMFTGPALGMIADPLRKEFTAMMREGLSGLLGRDDNNERRPAHMSASQRDDDSESARGDRRGAA